MTNEQLHWVAGWLEGEGSFFMGKNGTAACIQAFSTDKDVIERVCSIFRVNPYYVKPRKHPSGWTSTEGWRFGMESENAISLMKEILPFMCIRRTEKIKEVLLAWENRPNKPVEKECACGCGRRFTGRPRMKYARRGGACAQAAYRQKVSR